MNKKNTVIVTVAGGFYYFGEEVKAQEGYVALKNAAMFMGYDRGKGVPGVARGDKDSNVKLGFFTPGDVIHFPILHVYAITPCIDLSTWGNTEKL